MGKQLTSKAIANFEANPFKVPSPNIVTVPSAKMPPCGAATGQSCTVAAAGSICNRPPRVV